MTTVIAEKVYKFGHDEMPVSPRSCDAKWGPWLKVAATLSELLLVKFANDNATGATRRREHVPAISMPRSMGCFRKR
jgi:hypothetical protein